MFGLRRKRVADIDGCFNRYGYTPQKLLDVGFGNVDIAEYFVKSGIEVCGIEIDKKRVRDANERLPNDDFRWYNGKEIPFDDSVFDTIILNDVLEHISYNDIEILLPEIKRVLTPKGVIYISVMNRWQLLEPHKLIPFLTWLPRFTWHSICKKLRNQDYIYYWPYTRKGLQSLFKRHGFNYKDMTDIYVMNKFRGINQIGSQTVLKIFNGMKSLHLTKIAYILALKVSVLLYLAWKLEEDR